LQKNIIKLNKGTAVAMPFGIYSKNARGRAVCARWCHKVDTPHKLAIRRAHATFVAPCYYSAKAAICKYPKSTIFCQKFRDISHISPFCQ
jgi:hypothetical protein